MTDDERQAQVKELLADGLRMSLVYDDGAYWWIGYVVRDGTTLPCCRVEAEWLLDEQPMPTFFGTDSVGPQPNPVFRPHVEGKIQKGKLKG